jgi:hypothetical protein
MAAKKNYTKGSTLSDGDCFFSGVYRAARDYSSPDSKNLLPIFQSCLGINIANENTFINSLREYIASRSTDTATGVFEYLLEKHKLTRITTKNIGTSHEAGYDPQNFENPTASDEEIKQKAVNRIRKATREMLKIEMAQIYPRWQKEIIEKTIFIDKPNLDEFLKLIKAGIRTRRNWASQIEAGTLRDLLPNKCRIFLQVNTHEIDNIQITKNYESITMPMINLYNPTDVHFEYFRLKEGSKPAASSSSSRSREQQQENADLNAAMKASLKNATADKKYINVNSSAASNFAGATRGNNGKRIPAGTKGNGNGTMKKRERKNNSANNNKTRNKNKTKTPLTEAQEWEKEMLELLKDL